MFTWARHLHQTRTRVDADEATESPEVTCRIEHGGLMGLENLDTTIRRLRGPIFHDEIVDMVCTNRRT